MTITRAGTASPASASSAAPEDTPESRRLTRWGIAAFALVVYVPILLMHMGKVEADTKQYLYMDPGRLLNRAATIWDPSIGMGTLSHQTLGYVFPSGPFYWLTYAITWVLPIVGLRLGIRDKDRMLLDVSLAAALVTLLTNKPYLGSVRHEWDPMLLGVLLAAVAIGVRRWLASGPANQRSGLTPARLAGKDSVVLTALRTASGAYRPDSLQPASGIPQQEPVSPAGFDGGRSGGGGGGAAY